MKSKGLVYSTETGRLCPECGEAINDCQCKNSQDTIVGDGKVRVSRETKGRKGKGVSLVTGIPLVEKDLKKLAKELKQKCGVGGTINNGVIEIQGDHRDLLVELLKKKGYDAKKSGG